MTRQRLTPDESRLVQQSVFMAGYMDAMVMRNGEGDELTILVRPPNSSRALHIVARITEAIEL